MLRCAAPPFAGRALMGNEESCKICCARGHLRVTRRGASKHAYLLRSAEGLFQHGHISARPGRHFAIAKQHIVKPSDAAIKIVAPR